MELFFRELYPLSFRQITKQYLIDNLKLYANELIKHCDNAYEFFIKLNWARGLEETDIDIMKQRINEIFGVNSFEEAKIIATTKKL